MISGSTVTLGRREAGVGVPIGEAALTSLVRDQPEFVLPSGEDQSGLVVLEEVEVGIGRPDLLVLRVDLAVLSLRYAAGLRLDNLTEARVLGAHLESDPAGTGVSCAHAARVTQRLESRGWLEGGSISPTVLDSVLIEAKVTHWGAGVHQLVRVRWASHHAALLVPDETASRVPNILLKSNDLGLLAESAGRLLWQRASPRRDLSPHLDAWLGELALRRLLAT